MIFKAVAMGFAVIHEPYLTKEFSLNFQEAGEELSRVRNQNFIYTGDVNTGEDECKKRGVTPPIRTSLSYTSDLQDINQRYRKQKTHKGRSSINEPVWPTVVLMFDQGRNLIGMITLPDSSWGSVRTQFLKDLDFFLNPFGENYDSSSIDINSGLQSPNPNIIEINFSNWKRELRYEIEAARKKLENSK